MPDTQPSASALSDFKWPELPQLPMPMFIGIEGIFYTRHQMQGYANAYGEVVRVAIAEALPAQVSEPIGYIKTTDLKFVATYSVQSQMVLYRDGNKNRTALYTAPPQAVVAQPVDADDLAIADTVAKELWLCWNASSAQSWEKVVNKEKYLYPARKAIETLLGWKPRSAFKIGRTQLKAAKKRGEK